jgi:CHAT domain-containing protein/tetratricopeptide (TPR) repeat protein
MNRATALLEQGRHEEAEGGYDEALPLYHEHAPPAEYAGCLLNRANALFRQGLYKEAEAGYDEALPLLREHGPPANYARCLVTRANALLEQGLYKEAEAGYDEALPLLREHGPPAYYAHSLAARAAALQLQGLYKEAEAGYDEALPLLREHALPAYYAQCLSRRAGALHLQGRHIEAVETYEQARRELRRARRLGRIDETGLEFGAEWEKIFRFSIEAALVAGRPDKAHESACDGKAGLLDDLRLRQQESESEPEKVGRARGELTDWMRHHAPTFPAGKEPPTEAQLKLFAQQVAAFRAERDRRTRAYITTWGQVHHAYSAGRPLPQAEDPPTLAEIQACLPADWAVIDFWRTANDEFTTFVLFHDHLHVQKLTLPFGRLKRKLQQFVRDLRSPTSVIDQGVLNDLYAYLFLPLRNLLQGHRTQGLYLVPHDFLHVLPLHAAKLGDSCLCDEYTIAYLPSAALLSRLPALSLDGSAFIVSNPGEGTDSTLPFSTWEGQKVRDRFGGGSFHPGKAGTYAATAGWSSAGLAHFSCHGYGDAEFAPRSHLCLADDLLLAHDVVYRRPSLREGALVVLNGCETGLPDLRALDEAMGLMTAFLLKGAALVLSTQWSVADLCAAEMVLTFVDELRRGGAPAMALRVAQKVARDMSVPRILDRINEVEAIFPIGSPEHAKLKLNRAWVCWHAGLLDEARQAARQAEAPLRRMGLAREVESLFRTLDEAQRTGGPPPTERPFASPAYWAAFQLVGRAT